MNIDEKRISKKFLLVFLMVNFSVFLLYFASRFISGDSTFADIIKISLFCVKDLHKTLMPMMVATAALISYAEYGSTKAVLRALAYASTWTAYAIPYYAFYYADGGLVIGDVLIFMTLLTLGTLAAITIVSLLTFIFIIFITKRNACKQNGRYSFAKELKKCDAQNFSLPITVGIFAGAVLLFAINIAIELGFYTIPYLIETAGTYRTGEIIYMVFRYTYILAMLLICYFGAYRIKKLYK